jgi:hypothetical protein
MGSCGVQLTGLTFGQCRASLRLCPSLLPSNRERLPTGDTVTDPSRMFQRRAFVAAARAARTQAQHVARRVRTPSDDQRRERHRRVVPAPGIGRTVDPNPSGRAVQFTKRCHHWRLHSGASREGIGS